MLVSEMNNVEAIETMTFWTKIWKPCASRFAQILVEEWNVEWGIVQWWTKWEAFSVKGNIMLGEKLLGGPHFNLFWKSRIC